MGTRAGETAFWAWFSDNEERLYLTDEPLDEIHERLERCRPEFSVEVSRPFDERRELIISARGQEGLFDSVRELVDGAPSLGRWEVIALKPPRGFAFVYESGGGRLNPSELSFEPLKSDEMPDALGLRVFVPTHLLHEDIDEAVQTVIETGLGEEQAARVEHLEVEAAPDGASERISLARLAAYLVWLQKP